MNVKMDFRNLRVGLQLNVFGQGNKMLEIIF